MCANKISSAVMPPAKRRRVGGNQKDSLLSTNDQGRAHCVTPSACFLSKGCVLDSIGAPQSAENRFDGTLMPQYDSSLYHGTNGYLTRPSDLDRHPSFNNGSDMMAGTAVLQPSLDHHAQEIIGLNNDLPHVSDSTRATFQNGIASTVHNIAAFARQQSVVAPSAAAIAWPLPALEPAQTDVPTMIPNVLRREWIKSSNRRDSVLLRRNKSRYAEAQLVTSPQIPSQFSDALPENQLRTELWELSQITQTISSGVGRETSQRDLSGLPPCTVFTETSSASRTPNFIIPPTGDLVALATTNVRLSTDSDSSHVTGSVTNGVPSTIRESDSRLPQANSCPPQANSCPPQDNSCPPQANSCPPQDNSCPPQANSCPPQDNSCPPQANSCPPQDNSCPPQANSCPPQDNSERNVSCGEETLLSAASINSLVADYSTARGRMSDVSCYEVSSRVETEDTPVQLDTPVRSDSEDDEDDDEIVCLHDEDYDGLHVPTPPLPGADLVVSVPSESSTLRINHHFVAIPNQAPRLFRNNINSPITSSMGSSDHQRPHRHPPFLFGDRLQHRDSTLVVDVDDEDAGDLSPATLYEDHHNDDDDDDELEIVEAANSVASSQSDSRRTSIPTSTTTPRDSGLVWSLMNAVLPYWVRANPATARGLPNPYEQLFLSSSDSAAPESIAPDPHSGVILRPDDPAVLVDCLMSKLTCPICYRGFRRKKAMVNYGEKLFVKRRQFTLMQIEELETLKKEITDVQEQLRMADGAVPLVVSEESQVMSEDYSSQTVRKTKFKGGGLKERAAKKRQKASPDVLHDNVEKLLTKISPVEMSSSVFEEEKSTTVALETQDGMSAAESEHETAEIRVGKCGHVYCDSCIKKYVIQRKKCPVCNQPLSTKQLHPLYL